MPEDLAWSCDPVTVAPTSRRQGLATALMKYLEDVTVQRHNGRFVDLFVRRSGGNWDV
jgi:ribosomal protein S18 acetylase RimI-like enzyme